MFRNNNKDIGLVNYTITIVSIKKINIILLTFSVYSDCLFHRHFLFYIIIKICSLRLFPVYNFDIFFLITFNVLDTFNFFEFFFYLFTFLKNVVFKPCLKQLFLSSK